MSALWVGVFAGQASAALLAVVEHGGHTYHVYDDALTWQQARDFAGGVTVSGQVGYLARIDAAAENAAIYSSLLSHDASFDKTAGDGGRARYVWLGANDLTTEGVWQWAQGGDQFWQGNALGVAGGELYNNWGTTGTQNEPDNFNNQDASAIALDDWPVPAGFLGEASQWNDIDAGNLMPFIVEFDAPGQAAPLQVVSLICDALTGFCTLSFVGAPNSVHQLIQSQDLDFTDATTVLPWSSSVGTIEGANIITSANGIATVTFPIGNASRLFLRVELP